MIVLSVALVVIAAGLLIVGIVTKGVIVIYLSIAASAGAAALLFVGVRSTRAATGPAAESLEPAIAADPPEPVPARASAAGRPMPGPVQKDEDDEDGGEGAPSLGSVMVVSGRPRYHRFGCRFLSGREDAEEIAVEEAREVGFTPCGVCKPDEALAVATADEVVPDVAAAEAQWVGEGGQLDDEGEPPVEPVEDRIPPTGAGADEQVVVVIPDRGKYHRAECRFVRGVAGTLIFSRTDATQQGYTACGVCKP